ncbi:YIEGIA family protein [Ectobacillus ponti]|uniref:YIEGIA family protein n=1 Tax=Ectobacillus ponti TaxID=2961894 RepID=A0AA42BSS1_9BACI|nr:YIEGIA family protein [Ectobacillus ponti]MCP8968743.1 YIEGIA family protein [Ectobacillus ponti]
MNDYTYPILLGVIVGLITRLLMLRTDARQYPSRLHGKIIHVAMGFIAAALGAIAIPSIMKKDFSAITFLTLAASQFRDVRNMERNTLQELDEFELVKRGNTYIEGIAMVFESRNYLAIFTSFATTFAYLAANSVYAGLAVGLVSFLISRKLMTGHKVRDIADIRHVPLRFEGAGLYIDNIYIMNIGLPARQDEILKYGMGFVLTPKSMDANITLANLGQRQAILHDASVALGVFRDSGTPALVPLAKRDLNDGRVGVLILPQEQDPERAARVIGQVPTLENAIRKSRQALNKENERT